MLKRRLLSDTCIRSKLYNLALLGSYTLWSKPGVPDIVLPGVNNTSFRRQIHRTKSGVFDAVRTVYLMLVVRYN